MSLTKEQIEAQRLAVFYGLPVPEFSEPDPSKASPVVQGQDLGLEQGFAPSGTETPALDSPKQSKKQSKRG